MPETETLSRPPLLPTPNRKTSPPDHKGLTVVRHRLLDQLRRGAPNLTLIQGAAGFGKTMLAAQWAEALGHPLAWVTFDATDNDPVVMISTVVTALSRAGLDVDWGETQLTGDEPTYSQRVLPHYRIALESQAPPLTLVLDDAHELTQPGARSLLRMTVESVPEGSAVILIGRYLGAMPLTSWLSKEGPILLSDADLTMDVPETTELLTGVGNGTPGRSAVDELLEATGGWPIAVYLGARLGDAARLADDSHFGSFLDHEALKAADSDTVRFLTLAASLEGLSGEFCDHVLETQHSGAILARAEQASLLITSSKDHGWYRLHPLLREHLGERLRAMEPERYRTIMRRASEWTRQAGYIDLAITYARASGDVDLLGMSVWEGAAEALLAGQSQRVLAWLGAIDERDVARSCPLALSATWTAVNRGMPADAYRWGQAVFANVYEGWESNLGRSSVEAGVACLLGVSGELGYERSAELVSDALRSLPPDHVLRPFAQMLAGWMQALGGKWDLGIENMRHAADLARGRGVQGTEVEANCLLATALLSRGDVHGAEPLIQESIDAWEQRGISNSLASRALLIGPATLMAARSGQVDLTRTRLEQADELSVAFGPMLPWLHVVIEALSAAAHMHLGDRERAVDHLARAAASDSAEQSPLLSDLMKAARDTVEGVLHLSELSPAERRVWDLLQTRATLREIADQLFVSPETVKTQTGSIYRKLGIASRREAQEMGDRLHPLATSVHR